MAHGSTHLDPAGFTVPAHDLKGSPEDVVADIDRAITGLLVLRRMVSRAVADERCRDVMPGRAADVRDLPFEWLDALYSGSAKR